ncbi:MAG: hypothetical protein KAR54_02290 [Candidatus Pacebacteria bacterium]|nr:hypothetical protein [Candidatus Paceibacterota bacterium]
MIKTFIALFIFTLFVIPVFSNAQQNQLGVHEPGTGLIDPELKATTQEENRQEDFSQKAISRRSRVANSVQEIERIATRNAGIGNQIRVIAQNQNQNQEQMENSLEIAQQRKGFTKFLIGPNYGQLKDTEERLENHNQNLEELKGLRDQIQVSSDQILLDQQIQVMEDIKLELEGAIGEEQKGFSLFGWLNRLRAR